MRTNCHVVDCSQFEKIVKPEVAYILGLLWADGCIYHRRNEYQIKLSMVSEDMKYIIPILDKIGTWNYSMYTPKIKTWKEKTSAYVYNKNLYYFLYENGYYSKSYDSACKILSVIPSGLHKYWWRGLFDGDGYFYGKNKSMTCGISSEYEQDWKYIENLCKDKNWKYGIYRYMRSKGSQSEFRIMPSKHIIEFGEFIYDNYDNILGLTRKYEKFLFLKNNIYPNIRQKHSLYNGVYFRSDNKRWFIRPSINGKIICVGGFKTDIDAHNALQKYL